MHMQFTRNVCRVVADINDFETSVFRVCQKVHSRRAAKRRRSIIFPHVVSTKGLSGQSSAPGVPGQGKIDCIEWARSALDYRVDASALLVPNVTIQKTSTLR